MTQMKLDSRVVMGVGLGLRTGGDRGRRIGKTVALVVAATLVIAVLVWQALTAHGDPHPDADGVSHAAAIVDTGVLVFREGLEAVIVLAALTASLARTEQGYWKPVAMGAGASFLASVATWFIVVAIVSSFNASALHVQAATGLLAIIVLLVIMNWFFHKVYWTGWITHHNRRKKSLTETPGRSGAAIFRGLALIGFTSVYREGFEVVLFLQSIRIKVGSWVVFEGVSIGLGLTMIVALLTFVAHYRLPYKKMLVLTGILLGAVLMVMVGEQVQEMQQANWIRTHHVEHQHARMDERLVRCIPDSSKSLCAGAGICVCGRVVLSGPAGLQAGAGFGGEESTGLHSAGLRELCRIGCIPGCNLERHPGCIAKQIRLRAICKFNSSAKEFASCNFEDSAVVIFSSVR